MRMTNPKSNMPLLPPGSRPKRPIPPNSSGPKPIRPPKGGVMPMAMGGTVQKQFGTVKARPTPRPGTNMPLVMNPPSGKPMGKPMGKPGVKMAMGGTVQSRPKGSSPRPGEKPFSPGMPKLPRIKMAMGGTAKAPKKMTLPPGAISGGPYRVPPKVPGGGYTNKPPRLPPGMKPMGMKDGGMAHGTKAKKGRGMAIMIAIGKPKGRGKS